MSLPKVFVAVALVLQCVADPSFAVDYPVYDLGSVCDQSITVPCPHATAQAGTLKFLQRPLLYCSVEIKLADNCGGCVDDAYTGKYAFYFNVRNFTKYPTDAVYFRKSKLLGLAVKQLTGSVNPTNNPPSVAQYKTDLADRPNLFIEYVTYGAPLNTEPIEVIIDFVVLGFALQAHSNIFCDALDDYVHRDLICDTTDNRVNCPESYREDSGFNAADDRQCSDGLLDPLPDVFDATYPIFDIDQRCRDVITIPCPTEDRGRSGRLHFNHVPKSTCEVTVQLERNCTNSIYDSFAIYLNMKQMNVIPGDTFLIYETVRGDRWLRKQLTTGLNVSVTDSVAQFLTEYVDQPRIDLVYNRTNTDCLSTYKIAIDYTILHGSSLPSSRSTYCHVLHGFIHNDLLCTHKDQRINCPDNYKHTLDEDPARDVQCTAEEGTPYQLLYLEDTKPTLTIPCPTSADGRVGTLHSYSWHYANTTSFSINFTLPSGCGGENEMFAFYFNIRSLTLLAGSSLTFSKQYPGETQMRVEKQFVGPVDHPMEMSVAQYLTPFEKQPFITLAFVYTYEDSVNSDSIEMNYAVYSNQNNTGSAYCPALNGYIKDDLLCDTDGRDGRINCPLSYDASLSLNPARERYCTKERTTVPPTTKRSTTARTTSRSTTRTTLSGRTTTRTTARTTRLTATTRRTSTSRWPLYTSDIPWYYTPAPAAQGLDGGAIAGIVIGVLAGVAILIAVAVLVCRRSGAPSKGQPPVSYTTSPNVHAPVVVGHAPQATAPHYGSNQPQPDPTHRAPYPAGQQVSNTAGQPLHAPPFYAAVAHPTHPLAHS